MRRMKGWILAALLCLLAAWSVGQAVLGGERQFGGLCVSELLEIKHLNVVFSNGGRRVEAISDLSLSLGRRETLGIVGESGSGKSVA